MKVQAAGDHGKPKKLYQQLYVQVLIGVMLGILVGHFWPEFGAAMKPFGDIFVKLVKMMIPPVVFCTIASGIYSMHDNKEIGKTLLKALGLFYILTIIALVTGLAAVYLLKPGVGLNIDPASIDPGVVAQYTKQAKSMGFVDFIVHIIPSTFFAGFTEGEVLPVLLLSILIGFGLTRVGAAGDPIKKAIDSFSVVLFAVFNFLMKLAPLGAFGGMAFTVGRYGIRSIGSLGMLIVTFYVACGFFVFVVLNLLARLHGFSLMKLLRYTKEELLIVLGTSSTEPVLPRLLYKLERLGCKKGAVGLVLPAGYSFNLDGTAIYLTLASVFITQAMNIELSLGTGARHALRDAAHLKGRSGRNRQRLRCAGRDAHHFSRGAGGRRGHHCRHRPLHVGSARSHQQRKQHGGRGGGRNVGECLRPRGAASRARQELRADRGSARKG
jgi:aerobic C4-dicarboxylate transport protein